MKDSVIGTLELRSKPSGSAAALPNGTFRAVQVQNGIIDLQRCAVEKVGFADRSVIITSLVPDWQGENPARATFTFGNASEVSGHSVERDPEVDSLTTLWHRGTRFTLRMNTEVGSPAEPVKFRADTFSVEVHTLSLSRPPYVRVFYDEGLGLWDSVTGRGGLAIQTLDLQPTVRDQIDAWLKNAESGHDDLLERTRVIESLRRAWPDSIVLDGPVKYR